MTSGQTDYFADALGGLPDTVWDEIAGERFYSTALWLRLCGLPAGSTSGGLHVDLPGGGRAALPIASVQREPNPNSRWQDLLTARGLPSPAPEGILVGARRGYLSHVMTTPGADRKVAAEYLLKALRSLPAPRADVPPAQVAMYLTTEDVLLLRACGVDTLPVALNSDAWIAIPEGGFEDWLSTLSAGRRNSVRREMRRFEEAGYQVEEMSLGEAHEHVARLLARTELRYGRSPDVEALIRSFRTQGEVAGEHGRVLLCSKEGQPPVAFCLFYRRDDTVYLRAVGFDYDRLDGAGEYFNLAYYLPIQRPGVRWLHAGISSQEVKAARGAVLRPLWLLDLSERSVLTGLDAEIRAHNAGFVAKLSASSPLIDRALDSELWDAFS
ncbi:hypothetical protein ABIA35_002118 [Catenulispora sp. MAP12-49]|uniref:GNAT family N-acetyltransferase n=1 Tax=Catenulispora sp. MAP12-49 TaxID=3156302 RepID=UPI003517DC58